MIEHPRVPVLDEPEYTAEYHVTELEPGKVMTFVHLDVYFMSPRVLRELKARWTLWRQACPITLYCIADDDSETWGRFVSLFGFRYFKDLPCTDGKTRRLFINTGPQGGP